MILYTSKFLWRILRLFMNILLLCILRGGRFAFCECACFRSKKKKTWRLTVHFCLPGISFLVPYTHSGPNSIAARFITGNLRIVFFNLPSPSLRALASSLDIHPHLQVCCKIKFLPPSCERIKYLRFCFGNFASRSAGLDRRAAAAENLKQKTTAAFAYVYNT